MAIVLVVLPFLRISEIRDQVVELETEITLLEFELDVLEGEAASVQQEEEDLKEHLENLRELKRRTTITSTKHAALKNRMDEYWILLGTMLLGGLSGIAVAAIGFHRWYHRYQKYQDAIIKREAAGESLTD